MPFSAWTTRSTVAIRSPWSAEASTAFYSGRSSQCETCLCRWQPLSNCFGKSLSPPRFLGGRFLSRSAVFVLCRLLGIRTMQVSFSAVFFLARQFARLWFISHIYTSLLHYFFVSVSKILRRVYAIASRTHMAASSLIHCCGIYLCIDLFCRCIYAGEVDDLYQHLNSVAHPLHKLWNLLIPIAKCYLCKAAQCIFHGPCICSVPASANAWFIGAISIC